MGSMGAMFHDRSVLTAAWSCTNHLVWSYRAPSGHVQSDNIHSPCHRNYKFHLAEKQSKYENEVHICGIMQKLAIFSFILYLFVKILITFMYLILSTNLLCLILGILKYLLIKVPSSLIVVIVVSMVSNLYQIYFQNRYIILISSAG